MYKKNPRTQQPLLISDINHLPERTLKFLRNSWADTFRREVFQRIPEERFRALYDQGPSRPNIPVNVLVGLEIIKQGKGWSDEELYEHFLLDLQVRYAVGCDNLGEGDFELRTLYYFRNRLSKHALETGENLFKVVFDEVTGEQIKKLGIKTDMQRMDSTQLLSNIADLSRLELLVEVLRRLQRDLQEEDKAKYAELFAPYTQQGAGQYAYRIKGKEAVWAHIQQVGEVLQNALNKLRPGYGESAIYQVAQRFFDENFKLVETAVKAKINSEIEAGCLQSLDDLEASYRVKGGKAYKGYVGNVSETCNPENPVQLIVHTQTASNRAADTTLITEALPELSERTGLETIINDGAYVGPEVEKLLRQYKVNQITTSLTGATPDHTDGKLAFSDFDLQLDADGNISNAICPAGQQATCIRSTVSQKTFYLEFQLDVCQQCLFFQNQQCPITLERHKRSKGFSITVPKERAISSQRRRRFEQTKAEARRLRPAVETTIFQLKHALHGGKLRIRGPLRVACVFTCMALAANLRRINRYEHDQQRGKYTSKKAHFDLFDTFVCLFQWLVVPFRRISLTHTNIVSA
jgi:hypothetical protein